MKDRLGELTANRTHGGEVDVSVDRHGFMEGFFRRVGEVRRLIDKISYQVEEVRKMHSTILSAPNPDAVTKEGLNRLTNHIKDNAITVRSKLRSMEHSLPKDDMVNRNSVDIRIQKTQVSRSAVFYCCQLHYVFAECRYNTAKCTNHPEFKVA